MKCCSFQSKVIGSELVSHKGDACSQASLSSLPSLSAQREKALLQLHSLICQKPASGEKLQLRTASFSPLPMRGVQEPAGTHTEGAQCHDTSSIEPHSSALKDFIHHWGIPVKNYIISADVSLDVLPPVNQQKSQWRRTIDVSHEHFTHNSLYLWEKDCHNLNPHLRSPQISQTPNLCLSFP